MTVLVVWLNEQTNDEAVSSVFSSQRPAKVSATTKQEKPVDAKVESVKPVAEPAKKPTSIFDKIKPATVTKPEAAKPAEKPAVDLSQDAEEKLQLHSNASPETVAGWKSIKEINKQLRSKASEVEAEAARVKAELAELRQRVPDPTEVDRLRKEHEAATKRLAELDLRSHPEFRRQYVEPKEKLAGEIATLLQDNAVEGVDLGAILNKPRADFAKSVSEVADRLNDFDRTAFMGSMREMYRIQQEEGQALSKAGELSASLQKRTQDQQRAAFEEVYKEGTSHLQPFEVAADAPTEERAAAEAYNKSLAGIRERAEQAAFGRLGEKDVAKIALKAATLDHFFEHAVPHIEREIGKRDELIASLQKELQGLKAQTPGNEFNGGTSTGGSNKLEEMGLEDAVKATFRR
jgi:hypothetical protein